MNTRQRLVYESYVQIVAQLSASKSPIANEVPAVLERFKSTVKDIHAYAFQQQFNEDKLAMSKARARVLQMRMKKMLPLARLARGVFAGEAAIQATLRVPHKRAAEKDILAAAALMVKTLRPHKKVLAAARIDPARIDELQTEMRALKKEVDAAQGAHADRAMPTRRLSELFTAARADMLVLDALIVAGGGQVNGTPWKLIRRVGKRMGRPPVARGRRATGKNVA